MPEEHTHTKSPWLNQIAARDAHQGIEEDSTRDVVIIGGGISGVMTAYYTLTHTDMHVSLLEGDRIAHGASGHNAGQLVSEFEHSFLELVEKFGTEKAVDAEQDIDRAWTLLETLLRDEGLTIPMSTFTGYAGYESLEDIERILRNQHAREEAGLEPRKVYLLSTLTHNARFTPYRHLYDTASQSELASLLETKAVHYHAVIAKKRGCMNSALLCEEVTHVLKKKFPDRFALHEHTHVSSLHLGPNSTTAYVHNTKTEGKHSLHAAKVILCTNGFENITIRADHNPSFDTKFHETVRGIVGSMVGYLEPEGKKPAALSFHELTGVLSSPEAGGEENAYFYFTRRPYEVDNGSHSLVCVGGPERIMEDTRAYDPKSSFDELHRDILNTFMKDTYIDSEGLRTRFSWHGLMGYTPSGMRIIGPDRHEKALWYNLGCNGIGLMTAIFGGYKISQLLKGDSFPASAFDPQ